MKKIAMGIAAVAMATAMFAAEPTFNESVAEYKGEASVTWGVDIDNKATGFKNAESASMKVNLFTAGDKTTEGDGIWAELKIKNDAKDTDGSWGLPAVSVDVAKFHIYDVYIGIRSGDVEVGGCKPQTAIVSSNYGIAGVASNKNATQGIVVGYANDYFGIDVDFRSDKTEQYTNKYGIAAEVALKAVENLDAKAGVTYEFKDDAKVAYAASVGYKLPLSGDYYLKPVAGYTGSNKNENKVAASLVFGWGDQGWGNPGVYYFNSDMNKTPGVSVDYVIDLASATDNGTIYAAFYLGDLVANTKAAADLTVILTEGADAKVTANAGAAYDIKLDDLTITPKAGISYANAAAGDKIEVKAGVDLNGLVDNTTFGIEYESGNLKASKAGTLNVSAQIHF